MPIKESLARIKGRVFNRGKHVEWLYGRILRKAIVLKSRDGFLFEFQPENSFARHINRKGFTDDQRVLDYVKLAVKPGDTCFDVGACFGVVTLAMAKYAGDKGRVFSFEAECKNYLNLKRNLEINGMGNATAYNMGVYSNDTGFELNVRSKEQYGDHAVRSAGEGGASVQRVDTVSLDGFCSREKIDRIDLVKIDVEGVEPEILEGSARLLKGHAIKRAVFEVSEGLLNNYGHSIEKLVSMFTGSGYNIRKLNDDGTLSGPMKDFPKTNFDNWVALAPGIRA